MTLLNPKPNRNAYSRKNYIYCKRCRKPFTADGRGKRPLHCKPCKVLIRRDYDVMLCAVKKRNNAFKVFWRMIEHER